MKKIILILMFFTFCYNISISFAAYDDFPLEGPEWEKKSFKELYSVRYEEGFLALYQVTEENLNSEKAFRAFLSIRTIAPKLKGKYNYNKIISADLNQLLSSLITASENPQTAKDYFYKALFEYPEDESLAVSQLQYDFFKYVVDNFPDTTLC